MRITAVHSHSKRFTLSIMLLITVILQIHSGNKLANVPNYYHKHRNPPGMHFLDANGVSTHIPWIHPSTRRPRTKSLEHISTSVNSWNFCNTISHVGFYSSDPLIYCRTRIPAHGIGPMIWSLCMYSSTHPIRMNIATVPCLCVCVGRQPMIRAYHDGYPVSTLDVHSLCINIARVRVHPAHPEPTGNRHAHAHIWPNRKLVIHLRRDSVKDWIWIWYVSGFVSTFYLGWRWRRVIKVRVQFSRLIYPYTLHVLFKWGITTHLTYIPF